MRGNLKTGGHHALCKGQQKLRRLKNGQNIARLLPKFTIFIVSIRHKVKHLIHIIMVFTREKFKELWEANSAGSGITFDDIAECAIAWGISSHPRTRPIDEITYRVLKAAQVNDAEEYNPNPASQCDGRIMIDLDKACEWLHSALYLDHERSIEHRYATLEELLNDFRKAMKGGNND